MKGRLLIVVSLVFVSLAMGACKKVTVTNLPAGVPEAAVSNWINASNDLNQAYSLTHAAEQAAFQLNKTGAFPDGPAYGGTMTGLGRAEIAENQAAQFLKTVPNDWSQPVATQIATFTTQILSQLAQASSQSALGIKNTTSQSNFASLIANIITTINLVVTLTQQIVPAVTAAPSTTPSTKVIPFRKEDQLVFNQSRAA